MTEQLTTCTYCQYAYPDEPPELPAMLAHIRRCPLTPDAIKLQVLGEAFDVAEQIGVEFKRQRDALLAACEAALAEDDGMYCTPQLRAAIANARGQ